MSLTFGSLFAGIGGMDLGLERAGMACKWQVEIDDYATRVLKKHWPTVPKYRDVRDVGKHNLQPVDLIAGGFPCQDISTAGYKAGIEGERSGLWSEYHRIICELRPRYVLVENVSALLERGIERVLGDLAGSGYDAEWSLLSACALGAPHTRQRVFILAYPPCDRLEREGQCGANGKAMASIIYPSETPSDEIRRHVWASCDPAALGMADGLTDWVGSVKSLGNAVVPQVAEWIGRQIINADARDAGIET